jgi:hypothetical protein
LAFATLPSALLFGGDFAGQYATFSPSDGKVIHVPDHLVPEAMIEWGQVPSCLECLVSEDWIMEDDKPTLLERSTVTVLPETGCGIDNLETSTFITKLRMDEMNVFDMDDGDALKVGLFFNQEDKNIHFIISINTENDHMQRCRVTIPLEETTKYGRKRHIEVVRERKTSKISSKGSAGNRGGGLYGSTVMELVGKDHIHRPFSDQEGVDVSSLEGYWCYSNDKSENVYWNLGANTLSIPGGLGSLVFENIPVIDFNADSDFQFSFNFILNNDDEFAATRRILTKCSITPDGRLSAKVYDLYKCY